MDSMQAMLMGMVNQGKVRKVFDWVKAAKIIHDRKAKSAFIGLSRDLEYTGAWAFRDGDIVSKGDGAYYLASNWATPVLILDGEDGNEIDCYVLETDTTWDEYTWWPEEARKILGAT